MYDDEIFDFESNKKFNRDIIHIGGIEASQRQSYSIPKYGNLTSKICMNNTISHQTNKDGVSISPTSLKFKRTVDETLKGHSNHERKSLGSLSRSDNKFKSSDRNSFTLTYDNWDSNFGKNDY